MSDESASRILPSFPESDAYIRRLDPDHIEMVDDVRDLKKRLVSLEKSSFRQERYLVGGWNEDGTKWIPGVRERVEDMSRRFGWMAAGLWTVASLMAADVATKLWH